MNERSLTFDRDVLEIITQDFDGLYSGEPGVGSIRGGQTAANAALAALDITGYASRRSEVLPIEARGASMLSPYIRHNILTLDEVSQAVRGAPYKDREKFQDELKWQEYARHVYARIGVRMFQNLRFEVDALSEGDGWNREMLCIDEVVSELESSGWLVNQTRMWLASHWTVRNGKGWSLGQERMYKNLLDGSRAANLLGWQWTVGAGTGKPYGFSRWQVDKRAPSLCARCPLKSNCPVQDFPAETVLPQVDHDPLLDHDPDVSATTGPTAPVIGKKPEYVMLTIDSLGDNDPAMSAHPDLPVIFVFNEDGLRKLQLSARRIAFYIETLRDLAMRRDLHVHLGDPFRFAREHMVAITYAPVPSFRKFTDLAEVHPYPWWRKPHAGSVRSFSSWRRV